jgi:hypothetical protein
MRRLNQGSLGICLGVLLGAVAIVSAESITALGNGSQLSAVEEERVWSRRFLEAKTRLRELREEHDRISTRLSLLRSFSCEIGENAGAYYNPYFLSKTEKQLELARKDLETGEQSLAGLHESLRRSGNPLSWQDSRLAIEHPEPLVLTPVPVVKDRDYWHKQLSIIDKRYDYLVEPLRVELFELVHARAPHPGEDISVTGSRLCIPFYSELQRQINELRQRQQEKRAALMEQARREGALPGWFR